MVVMSPEIRFITTVERLELLPGRIGRLITTTKRLEPAKRWSRGASSLEISPPRSVWSFRSEGGS